jgi:tripartite-type tricarboxylate transporter receptor subunit TctC
MNAARRMGNRNGWRGLDATRLRERIGTREGMPSTRGRAGRSHVAAGVAAVLAVVAQPIAPAAAQGPAAWPQRPVRMLVGLPPGGTTDLMARASAMRLSDGLGQPVIVDNRPGASGAIAGELVARATPDGYTLATVTTSTHAVAPLLLAKPRFDAQRDFTHITIVGNAPYLLLAPANFPAKTLREGVDWLRSQSGKLNYASSGTGTLGHLITEAMLGELKVRMTHVPFKGAGPVYPELMADRVTLFFDNPGASTSLVRAGKVRALAVSRPLPALPGVPTLIDAGLKGFDPVFWYGVVGPAGLPSTVVERVRAELVRGFGTEAGRGDLAGFGVEPVLSTPAEFTAQTRADIERWGRVARALDLRQD